MFVAMVFSTSVVAQQSGTLTEQDLTRDVSAGMEIDTDRPGSDFRNFALQQDDPVLCRDACRETAGCVAWTFVRPGWQGPSARCWLKHVAPQPRPHTCCISGVVSPEPPDAQGQDVLVGTARPSAAVRAEFGLPDVFTKMRLAADDGAPLNVKIWEYLNRGLAHWVVDGVPQDLVRIQPAKTGFRSAVHEPDDYRLGMSRAAAMRVLGNHVREAEGDTVVGDGIVLEFENNVLVYVDTGAPAGED